MLNNSIYKKKHLETIINVYSWIGVVAWWMPSVTKWFWVKVLAGVTSSLMGDHPSLVTNSCHKYTCSEPTESPLDKC